MNEVIETGYRMVDKFTANVWLPFGIASVVLLILLATAFALGWYFGSKAPWHDAKGRAYLKKLSTGENGTVEWWTNYDEAFLDMRLRSIAASGRLCEIVGHCWMGDGIGETCQLCGAKHKEK